MMLKKLIVLSVLVFALGWLSHVFYDSVQPVQATPAETQKQAAGTAAGREIALEPIPDGFTTELGGREKPSPTDRLKLADVHVTTSRITIDGIAGRRFETAIFTNTNSMDPLIDDGTQALQIIPVNESDIKIGDIISYDSGKYGIIIHRVAHIGKDDQGWYAITKGDNNPVADPFKVRFSQVRRVLVGVLY